MPALSQRTEGLLIRVLTGWTHGQIGTVLREVGLAQYDPGEGTSKQWINKDKRLKIIFFVSLHLLQFAPRRWRGIRLRVDAS